MFITIKKASNDKYYIMNNSSKPINKKKVVELVKKYGLTKAMVIDMINNKDITRDIYFRKAN